ncbi:hypothetical protein M422DRAFT_276547 [Sphaerobolus stellatus SS14]|uniref:Uncharacterized protein n=1 Tax=Sphaerobolus stellatus (strain SS14) TaxID=990650 RepID=A0A0C9UBZ6_SPHS4|nr:hypothetical protein M422DRAFT_276547 [Sphaerobolus stellatus SS14]
MATKRSYKICLAEKDISHAVTEAWSELVRYQDNYYHLLEDYNVLKESNLGDQVQSLEKQLQETKDNSAELSSNEDLILKNKHLKQELEYYVGRVQYALYGKDPAWADHNGYRITDIPVSDEEDDDEDLTDLPTIPEDIPQNIPNIPLIPPTKRAHPASKTIWNDSKIPPASITGILPKPLGKVRAEQWDQPALRGASEWIMEHDIHDLGMCRLYVEGKALPPHEWSPDHTVAMFCIDEYARSLPGLLKNLVTCHDHPDWMTEVIQNFNANPSGVPRNLQLEGLHVNVNDADVWYWINLIKPKYHGAETEVLLQSIFSTVGRWDQLVTGQWKRNDSPFLCSSAPARYTMHCNQKLDRGTFAYWLGCKAGTIWNKVTLCSQLWANEIALLKGGTMNQFRIHDDLLPFVRESPFYSPPSVGEPMDQDESDPEPTPIQPTAGSSSLADRLDY